MSTCSPRACSRCRCEQTAGVNRLQVLIDCRCEQSVLLLQVDELNGPALQLYRGLGYEGGSRRGAPAPLGTDALHASSCEQVVGRERAARARERFLAIPILFCSARPPRRRGGGLAPPLLRVATSPRAHPCSPRDHPRYRLVSKLLLGGVRERTLLVLQKPRPPAAAEAAEPEVPRGLGVVGRLLSGVRCRLKALR